MDSEKVKIILNKAILKWNEFNPSRAYNYISYAIKRYRLKYDDIQFLFSHFNKYTSKNPFKYEQEVKFKINGQPVDLQNVE